MRRLRLLYELLYAAVFEFVVKKWNGDEEMASLATALSLGGALVSNALLAVILYGTFSGAPPELPRPILFMVPIALLSLNYFLFIREHRYLEIVQRFVGRPSNERRRFKIIAWSYVLASYSVPLLAAVFFASAR